MTTNELKETCRKKGISFIPHHECGLCGQPTGWYLFERWPPYEVAYSSACGCCDSEARRSTWQEVLDWVCDKDGDRENNRWDNLEWSNRQSNHVDKVISYK